MSWESEFPTPGPLPMKTIHESYSWFCCEDSWTHLGYDKLRQRWKHCCLRCAPCSCPEANPRANQTDTNRITSYSKFVLSLLSHYEAPMYPGKKFLMGSAECIFPFLSVEKKNSCRSKRLYFLSGSIFDWQMTQKNEQRELRPIFS